MDYAMLDGAFSRMPNLEALTLTPYSITAGVTTAGTDVECTGYRRQQSNKTLASGTSFQNEADSVLFAIQDSTLSGSVPKMNDVLTDANSVAWTINTVTSQMMGSHWACNCTRRRTT